MGDHWVDACDLSSLRLLGTVGEGINPEAWMWYHRKIGHQRCPIVDTWWQTETGGIMMSPLPGAIPTKPGSCTKPLPGVVPAIVDSSGKPVEQGHGGWLVITKPWPGMLRGIWGDDARYKEQYWSKVPHMYLAGDACRQDADGYYWIMGRIDDVLNVAGHRLKHDRDRERAGESSGGGRGRRGRPTARREGRSRGGFCRAQSGASQRRAARRIEAARPQGNRRAGPARHIRFTNALPKTRSGKIMRRLLRDIASGKETVGDTTTLEDYSILAKLRSDEE